MSKDKNRKKPDPKKHSDIRVPDEDIKIEGESFKEALKKNIKPKKKK